jgi:tetraacyldisaccharide 4'-kinase
MREPAFWWHGGGLAPALLAPLAALYGAIASGRFARPGARAGVPVVCIGNLTVGGAGKTPTAMTVVRLLADAGEAPVLLSRGYGGACAGPLRVDPARHRAKDVGDEPLLLARMATTFVARDRVKGAAAAVAAGASIIVMDDGFQNPSLTKDCSVLVLDGRRGIGNGRMIPAGPLRAPLDVQLGRAAALVVVGSASGAGAVVMKAHARGLPVFQARIVPDPELAAALAGTRVLAFAGIGDPDKLFATLVAAGISVAATRSFPDHHRYRGAEARALCETAERAGLTLVTTEKDLARIQGEEALAGLAARARALPVTLVLDDPASFMKLLCRKIETARDNRGGTSPLRL